MSVPLQFQPVLDFTAADTIGPAVVEYRVYRKMDDGEFELLITLDVDTTAYRTGGDGLPSPYVDAAVDAGHTYTYRVDAVDSYDDILASNEVSVDIPE